MNNGTNVIHYENDMAWTDNFGNYGSAFCYGSFISKDKERFYVKKIDYLRSLIFTAALFSFSFFAEVRFYEKAFYLVDLSDIKINLKEKIWIKSLYILY